MNEKEIKIVFMGSPDFARIVLESLAKAYQVVGVFTQPDRPAGRGKILTPPPVKVFAQEYGIEIIQPQRLKEPEAQAKLGEWQPDVIIVAAFGQILRQNVLDLPRFGCVNVHASLLPRWRGAAPIQAAILHGDAETGVTIMKMDAGIDTGDMLAHKRIAIEPVDTALTLGEKLAGIGSELLLNTLPDYLAGKIAPQKQDDSLATYAGMLKKEEGLLDFTQPALELERRVRAFHPWPGTFTMVRGLPLKIHACRAIQGAVSEAGARLKIDGFPAVQTAGGVLMLDMVQPAGKKPMSGDVYLRGERGWEDENA
ncbi:MAG: methionyl-tRNA formyltransferase [Anaerolineaceae bacterium]